MRIWNRCAMQVQGGRLTGYAHAVGSVGLPPKVFVPHFPHIMERAPRCAQECTPAALSSLRLCNMWTIAFEASLARNILCDYMKGQSC